jgi:hypothetical protein
MRRGCRAATDCRSAAVPNRRAPDSVGASQPGRADASGPRNGFGGMAHARGPRDAPPLCPPAQVDEEVARYNAALAKFLEADEAEWEAVVATYRGDLQVGTRDGWPRVHGLKIGV